MTEVSEKLNALGVELNNFYLERREAIQASILALLSGEHVALVGPPGTAKSAMVDHLMQAVTSARHFKVALSKNRPPEAVLGPLDIKRFRECGDYVLRREGYATDCELIYLDEAGKMSPILGHDLLALLNEREIHEVVDGRVVRPAPLSTAFLAMNEMLTDDSDDAAALWDRILFRVVVDYLKDGASFSGLLTAKKPDQGVTVEWEALKHAIDVEVPAVELSDVMVNELVKLRHAFRVEEIHPSDRRWRAGIKALKASAYLAGRDQVQPRDIGVLAHVLWDTLDQREAVARLCEKASNPFAAGLHEVTDIMNDVEKGVADRQQAGQDLLAYAREANKKLESVRSHLDTMLMEAGGQPIERFKEVSDRHLRIVEHVFRTCMGTTDPDALKAHVDKRRGSGDGGNV